VRQSRITASVFALILLTAAAIPAADLIVGLGSPPSTTVGYYVGGFGEFAFPHSLDESQEVVVTTVFPAGIRFGGELHTTMFINGHGNVTFTQADGANMVPDEIQANATYPRIAPFFADTDTTPQSSFISQGGTSKGSNRIYWDLDAVNGIITVTWDDVGYFIGNTTKVNAYQLRLIRAGTDGGFDIEFRYEFIGWTSGDGNAFQQGTNGLGGIIARAGYTAADGVNFYELPQSGRQGSADVGTLNPTGTDLATAGGMLDLAQLTNVGTPGIFLFSIRRPILTITPATGTYTNGNPITFTVTYDQTVSGFTSADVSVTNGTLGTVTTVTPGLVFSVPVTPIADGNVVFTVAENAATNGAGNGNAATAVTVISDRTAPTVVSITPTGTEVNAVDVPFAVTFSEPMLNLVAADFTSTNGAAIALTGSGASWTVTVRSVSDGALVLTLPATSCTDRAGNTLALAGTATVTVDATGPSVVVTHTAAARTNSTAPVTFTFTFSEAVTGFTAADVVVANGTAGTFTPSSTTVYTLVLTPTADGLVSATVPASVAFDADGLGNFAGSKSFILDRVAPTVTIAPAGAVISTDGVFIFTFSEPMLNFDSGDFTITNGNVGAGPTLVPGTSATYHATINATGGGNVGITVNAGAGLTDLSGNSLGASTTATVTFTAGLAPLAITSAVTQPNTAATFSVTFTFTAAATGFTAGDVAISNGSAGALVDAGGGSYTMVVTPAGSGLVTISVAANACTVGAAGNESASLTVNHAPTGPVPTFTVAPASGAYPGQAVWVTISFSEDAAGFTSGDIVVTTGLVSDFSSIDARTYQALVSITGRPNTSGTLSLAAGVATGANSRASVAASINLMAPSTPAVSPGIGGSKGCGLGSGFALLLLWLVAGLNSRQRFAHRR